MLHQVGEKIGQGAFGSVWEAQRMAAEQAEAPAGQCAAAAASRGRGYLPQTTGEVSPVLPRPAAAFFAVLPGCNRPQGDAMASAEAASA